MKLARNWTRCASRDGRAAASIALGLSIAVLALLIGVFLAGRSDRAAAIEVAPRVEPPTNAEMPRTLEPVAPSTTQRTEVATESPAASTPRPAAVPVDTVVPRVVDVATNEPLPAYEVGIYSFEARELGTVSKVTDAAGLLTLDPDANEGHLRFEMIDDVGLGHRNHEYLDVVWNGPKPPSAGETTRDGAVKGVTTHDLRTRTGPTCFLEFAKPDGYSNGDFEAELAANRPFHGIAWPPPGNRATVRAPSAATKHPELPWVRFGEVASWSGRGWVELRSSDAKWHGGGWIESVVGIQAKPLAIALEPVTTVTGRFEWSKADSDGSPQFVLTERLPVGSSARPRVYAALVDEAGALTIPFVEPGAYRLSLHHASWAPLAFDVTVVPGRNDVGTHRLEPRPIAGAVRGTITSKSGTYDGACHVSLSHTPFEHDALFDHSLDFEADETGKLVARIEFEDVTAGEWYLYVHCHDGFVHESSLRVVTAPTDDVRIELDDASISLEMTLVDARTGKPLADDGSIDWRCGDESDREEQSHLTIARLPDRPAAFEFLAEARGFRPVRGTAANFERSVDPVDGRTHLRGIVTMHPGWGTRILARERGSWNPLAGVDILLDGAPAGTTDENGALWIERATRPQRIQARKVGWSWEPSTGVVVATGIFDDDAEMNLEFVRL